MLLSAAVCQLDPHQRIDEGDHCLGQAVEVDSDGINRVTVTAQERRFNGLALAVHAVAPSAAPARLRVQ